MPDKEPSVEGNKVVFYSENDDLPGIEGLGGSIELEQRPNARFTGRKIFKNKYGRIYKIETFQLQPFVTFGYETKKWWEIWK